MRLKQQRVQHSKCSAATSEAAAKESRPAAGVLVEDRPANCAQQSAACRARETLKNPFADAPGKRDCFASSDPHHGIVLCLLIQDRQESVYLAHISYTDYSILFGTCSSILSSIHSGVLHILRRSIWNWNILWHSMWLILQRSSGILSGDVLAFYLLHVLPVVPTAI